MQTLPVTRNSPEDWEEYYTPEGLPHEWLCGIETFRPYLEAYFPNRRLEICDFGCGTSLVPTKLAEEGWGIVTCLDWAASAASWQSSRFGRAGGQSSALSECEARCCDCQATEFGDSVFDVVFCKAMLEFAVLLGSATEAVAPVHEVFRILKPGGIAFFCAQLAPSSLRSLVDDTSLQWQSVTIRTHTVEGKCLTVIPGEREFSLAICRKAV